jgi:prevent-host-death family protein
MDHIAERGGSRGKQAMKISVSEAKSQLTDLVKRAEAGDEVILTRRGREVARLVPIVAARSPAGRRALMEKVRASASAKATSGPDAARSQDFLYGDDGLPA